MKVYFTGAHSVGKTTLARYVSERYNLPMIPEVARTILSEKELQLDALRTDLKLVDSYQEQIFKRQLEEESQLPSFVSDRSFDCLSYAAQHSTICHELFESKELKEYIINLKKSDVYLFFVRPSKLTLKNDGVREILNWDGIIAIDAMTKLLFRMWNLKHFQISMDSMQERTQFVDSILSLL